MDISGIGSQAGVFGQQSATKESQLGQQEFLQLLVAQMTNQDPINPMDGAEFASQLAQFNSVEQLINVNSGLQTLQNSQDMMSASITNSMAASLTGKQVRALSDTISLQAGQETGVNFKLQSSADTVEVVIKSESGAVVRRETLSGMSSGDNQWAWDGKNDSGDRMGDGNYTVEVNASSGGKDVKSLVFTQGIASKVRYTGDGVFISVNNVEIPIGDVEEVGTDIF